MIEMTVIVGYIPTPEGEAALEEATREAERRASDLVVINSARREAYVDDRYAQDSQWQAIEERLEQKKISFRLLRPESAHDTATDLIEAAEQYGAELLVIGLRRRSAVGKLILGSTAQRVLLHAPCPVLAVKP
jgi:nucleotide-binding universal stress UspA family protein